MHVSCAAVQDSVLCLNTRDRPAARAAGWRLQRKLLSGAAASEMRRGRDPSDLVVQLRFEATRCRRSNSKQRFFGALIRSDAFLELQESTDCAALRTRRGGGCDGKRGTGYSGEVRRGGRLGWRRSESDDSDGGVPNKQGACPSRSGGPTINSAKAIPLPSKPASLNRSW